MNPIDVVRKTYPDAHKVRIFQRHERKWGWHTYRDEMPDLTTEKLVQLALSNHTQVSLNIVDDEGYQLASCSDYAIIEFFPNKTLTVKHPTDNRYITMELSRW